MDVNRCKGFRNVGDDLSCDKEVPIKMHQDGPTGKRNAISPAHNDENHTTNKHNMNNSHVLSPKGSVKRCLFSQKKEDSDVSVGSHSYSIDSVLKKHREDLQRKR